ncbi:hypothetical protein T12_10586 [Trichinella patagoniensis]|uniref:Uncharacterized protein n=1 Tax=Trichinella patagoniensis TaxID=990121 RepID=A0A0V1A6M2_9BILA|nr:hypothetical protein T12_10586 [Trichinella patagoniensis]
MQRGQAIHLIKKKNTFQRLEKRQLGFSKAKPRFTFLIIMTSGSKSLPALIITKVLELLLLAAINKEQCQFCRLINAARFAMESDVNLPKNLREKIVLETCLIWLSGSIIDGGYDRLGGG